MPQTQIACPRCRQMIPAQVEQLFDVTADPASKQRLLGGASNRARCSFCGFDGPLATPIVYHDNEKELLLTYFPFELGLPVNEQEKLVGPLITQVTNRLPAEKRKAYLLRPQSFLTIQSLIEKILEKDGVTKEMLDEQQKRVGLIQRLLQTTTADVRSEIIKQNQASIDDTFFALLGRLFEAALAQNQQQMAQALNGLQSQLLAESDFGKKVQGQMAEMEAASKTLQEIGQGLTREKLIEVMLDAPTDDRLKAYVSMTRSGLDYAFFQTITERVEKAVGDEKAKLETLRGKLLEFVNEIDKQVEAQLKQAQAFLEELLQQPDIVKATEETIDQFTEPVIQVLNAMMREAQQKNDSTRMAKLQGVASVLQRASAPPPELHLLEEMLEGDPADFEKTLEAHAAQITPEFMNMLSGLSLQLEQQPQENATAEDKAMMDKVHILYRAALKWQMKKNMQ